MHRKSAAINPLVHCSVAELMRIYIEEGLVTHPAMLGLPDFSGATLIEHGFDCVGDSDFQLYESLTDFPVAPSNSTSRCISTMA